MKKIQTGPLNFRLFLVFSAVLTVCGLFVSGCDLFTYKRPFADAYYNNNFIAAIGFDQFVGDDPTIPPIPVPDPVTGITPSVAVTGQWDFGYRYSNWDGTNYMTLSPTNLPGDPGLTAAAFSSVPAGLDSDAPVYRLELVNLIAGGDFEGTPALAEWTKDATINSSFGLLPNSAAGGIHNQSLQITLASKTSYVLFTIPNSVHTLEQAKGYQLDFKWNTTELGPTGRVLVKEASPLIESGTSVTFKPGTKIATSIFTVKDTNVLQFAADTPLSLVVDDITVKKIIPAQLRLLLTVPETNPTLESLLYRFSFWVCEDPSVGANTSPYYLNQLRADMQPVSGNSTMATTPSPYEYLINGDPATYGWQKMTVDINNGNLQFIDKTGTKPVMELMIDLEGSIPGRILIAQPELRCYPDGY